MSAGGPDPSKRVGTIWVDDGGSIWYYAWDDGNVLDYYASGMQSMDMTVAPTADAQVMWKMGSDDRAWSAIPSSLTSRPDPQVGMAQWVDSSGSLFLVGGSTATRDSSYVPFGSAYAQQPESGASLELWVFDPKAVAWHALHATASKAWPRVRFGATVWRERSGDIATGQHSNGSMIWMFGGWPSEKYDSYSLLDGGRTSSELWQYKYSLSRNNISGRWKLATANKPTCRTAGCTSRQVEPLYECLQGDDCPSPRKLAASWPSPNGEAGQFRAFSIE
jgi:hypothetical protein